MHLTTRVTAPVRATKAVPSSRIALAVRRWDDAKAVQLLSKDWASSVFSRSKDISAIEYQAAEEGYTTPLGK